ncbi:MAG: D-alanyl-D-alanine carboxypeptidase [Pricia sp.]
MNKTLFVCLLGLFLIGCASTKKKIARTTDTALASPFYDNQFTGFLVLDSDTNDTLYAYNSKKYFTPASNTKIFTLYAALQFLPAEVPAIKYIDRIDTLYVEGTGDPSFLHPFIEDSTALNFLRSHKNIAVHLNNFEGDAYGPGWSWGDYQYYYQPERSPLPLYGNVVTLLNSEGLKVTPSLFKDKVIPINFDRQRDLDANIFYYGKSRRDTVEIPFKTDSTLTRQLLEDVLEKKITIIDRMPSGDKSILYGQPSDTLYRRMMHESDNMIAEQLLLLASGTLSDTLSSERVRDSVLKNQLSALRQPPRWVDGSGLSRYNLFTPESMVHVLHKLSREIPKDRLFALFPAAGISGTLENWYPDSSEPYIFAKSGSLSNNYCISGYLITKSGKTLIFSFMNNHYRAQTSEVKKRMQRIFDGIRDSY